MHPHLSSSTISALLLLAASGGASSRLSAQEPTPRILGPVVSEHPEGMSSIFSLAELRDGRILVSDDKENVVRLLNFTDGSSREPGTRGRGPREYTGAGGIYRQRNGELWLLDAAQRRYLVYAADGRPARTEPFAVPSSGSFSFSSGADPHVVDGRGREYERVRPGMPGAPLDSAPVLRRTAARTDTMPLRLRNPETVTNSQMGARVTGIVRFSPSDGFAVAQDGSVAIVRAAPYRVEWLDENGRRRVGPPIEFVALPVTAADREAAARVTRQQMQGANMPRISQSGPDGQRRDVDLRSLIPDMPVSTHKPSIDPRRLRIDLDGRLWVGRYVALGEPEVYDVFNEEGRRVDRVQLPAGRALVGFGPGAVYVSRQDEDGLMFLGRIPYLQP